MNKNEYLVVYSLDYILSSDDFSFIKDSNNINILLDEKDKLLLGNFFLIKEKSEDGSSFLVDNNGKDIKIESWLVDYEKSKKLNIKIEEKKMSENKSDFEDTNYKSICSGEIGIVNKPFIYIEEESTPIEEDLCIQEPIEVVKDSLEDIDEEVMEDNDDIDYSLLEEGQAIVIDCNEEEDLKEIQIDEENESIESNDELISEKDCIYFEEANDFANEYQEENRVNSIDEIINMNREHILQVNINNIIIEYSFIEKSWHMLIKDKKEIISNNIVNHMIELSNCAIEEIIVIGNKRFRLLDNELVSIK